MKKSYHDHKNKLHKERKQCPERVDNAILNKTFSISRYTQVTKYSRLSYEYQYVQDVRKKCLT